MADEASRAGSLQLIAAVLGVPVSTFYGRPDANARPIDEEKLLTVLARFLRAFGEAGNPAERRRCAEWLSAEFKHLGIGTPRDS
ncbi:MULTISPECIES: hypothetical protein [unclassified Methylobacterium]|uniref:hypothetical protein n=1 Tax=unclassified Methylobacterium TaxID=2615210 RepID=UPI0011C1E914|nr:MULTISPECIES: hypothetical protein [unclassified Methylobacterium]QEE39370.1 hypothetical protein FVA80_10865 [Methylobacterium sp. WL1]TXN58241.1 hypothetical protein FV241_07705 [Methylobacterium sp. WL2]